MESDDYIPQFSQLPKTSLINSYYASDGNNMPNTYPPNGRVSETASPATALYGVDFDRTAFENVQFCTPAVPAYPQQELSAVVAKRKRRPSTVQKKSGVRAKTLRPPKVIDNVQLCNSPMSIPPSVFMPGELASSSRMQYGDYGMGKNC
ncbi:unnamed protein product [Soboliphyme baturini]|uniref:BZIP domain-containing protein n=1 Tax=Soboliphyme baturini TaxID=241478 RepID=A0A183J361_9BILA|nr:unnamed protein product [Soboliphyme baturini]